MHTCVYVCVCVCVCICVCVCVRVCVREDWVIAYMFSGVRTVP